MKADYKQIKTNEEINLLIEKGNAILYELGYTEHSKKACVQKWRRLRGRYSKNWAMENIR